MSIESDDDAPLVQAAVQQQHRASVAPASHRIRVTDFFKTVPTSEHIKIQNDLMQTDESDLRNIFKSSVRGK